MHAADHWHSRQQGSRVRRSKYKLYGPRSFGGLLPTYWAACPYCSTWWSLAVQRGASDKRQDCGRHVALRAAWYRFGQAIVRKKRELEQELWRRQSAEGGPTGRWLGLCSRLKCLPAVYAPLRWLGSSW